MACFENISAAGVDASVFLFFRGRSRRFCRRLLPVTALITTIVARSSVAVSRPDQACSVAVSRPYQACTVVARSTGSNGSPMYLRCVLL